MIWSMTTIILLLGILRHIAGEDLPVLAGRSLSLDMYRNLANIALAEDSQCQQDLQVVQKALNSNSSWAMKSKCRDQFAWQAYRVICEFSVLDSWGSLPSGLLEGNTRHMGNFDECLVISKTISEEHTLLGKYCFARLSVGQLFGKATPNANIAVCFPASCSASHMDEVLRQLFQQSMDISMNESLALVNESNCKSAGREPFDWLTVFTM